MGLLGQILGGIAGNALGRGSPLGRCGGGSSGVLMALLPVVLGMLANRSRSGNAGAGGGGLGGLGGLLGGGGGAGNSLGMGSGGGLGGLSGLGGLGGLAGMGGLAGLVDMFSRKGYGQQASSWVGTGDNEPLTPDAVGDVFGQDGLSQIAQQAGVSQDEARSGLAELLPEVVDHFTPEGQVPQLDQLSSSVDDYLNKLGP